MNDWELTKRLIADSAKRFARETGKHPMEILHDDGLYRHVKFGDSFYWFELITAPRSLTFRGDGTSYVFHAMDDMFSFFRRSGGGAGGAIEINPTYWEEKLTSDRKCVTVYSSELFDLHVNDRLRQAEREFPGVTAEWTEQTQGFLAEYDTQFEETAREALRDFQFGELKVKVSCSCGEGIDPTSEYSASSWQNRHASYSDPKHKMREERSGLFTFGDAHEWELRNYDWWYLWACHAIVWGIRQYDAAKLTPPIPALDTAVAAEVPAEDAAAELVTS